MSPAALDSSLKKEPEIRITPFVCFADTSLGEGGKGWRMPCGDAVCGRAAGFSNGMKW